MPEPRPLQTYSTLLEDRRIIEAAMETREQSSLIVHLLEKEWSIRSSRHQNVTGPGGRRFSYSQPISGILDDIQARRIPTEFVDIFKKSDIKFFDGCLIVEMHDSRPTKGGSTKTVDTRVDKYVLRPTAELLWADIRAHMDGQRGWGDREALELEARIVLSTAPPLCLDPSPSVNRMANIIARSGVDPRTASFKRKQTEDAEDDTESVKKRKLVQMMNPRLGKTFEPNFKILAAKESAPARAQEALAASQASQNAVAAAQKPQLGAQNSAADAAAQLRAQQQQAQMMQMAMQSRDQATQLAQQRLANGGIPPHAQQAAALLHRTQQFANAQQKAAAIAQARAGLIQNGSQAPGAIPQLPVIQNPPQVVKSEAESAAAAQFAALQNNRQFSLTMPPVPKRPSASNLPALSASPPKSASSVPPVSTPQQVPQNIQSLDTQTAQPTVQQQQPPHTPRQHPATPQMMPQAAPGMNPAIQNGANQMGMHGNPMLASYHQGLANGLHNQMQMAPGNMAYPNGAAGANRPAYPGMQQAYAMNNRQQMMQQQQQQQQQMGASMAMSQPQQHSIMQNAYQNNAGGFSQNMQGGVPVQMHPQQAGNTALPYGGMAAMQINAIQTQQRTMQLQAWMQNAELQASRIPPDQVAGLLQKAPEEMRRMPQWVHAANDRERLKMFFLQVLKRNYITQQQAHAQAQAQAQAAAAAVGGTMGPR